VSTALDALPARWRTDRLLLSERYRVERGARVIGHDEALLVLSESRRGVSVAGWALDGGAARLVTGLVDAGELAGPLVWMWLPRHDDLPPRVCEALGVSPLPGWDWMSSTTSPSVPGQSGVERLDVSRDLDAIQDCLADSNPETEADPTSAHEVGWWGVREDGRLIGVIGAGLRGGSADGGFTWHLHGLGVRPSARTRGLGTALTAAATDDGLAAGADWVSLGVWADNAPAISIYRRLGYRTDHENRSYAPVTP
jgi:ribosomal protein S18 acetylase RimI-like enzyme